MIVREQVPLGQRSIFLRSLKSHVELFALARVGPSCNRTAIFVGPGDHLLVRLGPARNKVFCQVFSRSQEDPAGGLRGRDDGLHSRLVVGEWAAGLMWQL